MYNEDIPDEIFDDYAKPGNWRDNPFADAYAALGDDPDDIRAEDTAWGRAIINGSRR